METVSRGNAIEIDISNAYKALDSLLMDNLNRQKDIRKLIKNVLRTARNKVSKDAKSAMNEDPRQAFRAVRSAVWKKAFGGNVNILAQKKASSYRAVRERKIHRARSERTEQIDGYWGKDRGFVLRFVNAGTGQRETKFGSRGMISARNWFGCSSERHVREATDELAGLIDRCIKEVWNEA